MGVKQMIVCINKMDDKTVKYSESRYIEIKKEMSDFLKKIGYNIEKINFIPISGWTGENIKDLSQNMNWYQGPSLVQAIEEIQAPLRPINKALRVPISDVYRIGGIGTVAAGCVQSGSLKQGMILSLAPYNYAAECKTI
jgi:elongation factor 1-alpha